MVEAILLPKAVLQSKATIDFPCSEVFPRFALRQHTIFINECCQQMNVIWHHNEIGQQVSLFVKLLKAGSNDLGKFGII